MRSLSGPERAILGGTALAFYKRVEIQNGSGTFKDLTNLLGTDFVDRVSLDDTIDNPTAQITVALKAISGTIALHPMRSDSPANVDDLAAYSPILQAGRQIKVWTQNSAAGGGSLSSDHLVFHGIVDEFSAEEDGEQITLTARDLGAGLMDTFIETVRTYGAVDPGVPLEDVLQQILDDNAPGHTLVVIGTPNWNLAKFAQERIAVIDVLRAKAQDIGWEVRYRWGAGNTSELQLYEPDRSNTTPDITLPPSEYLSLESLKIGSSNIRNVVRIRYRDPDKGDAWTYYETKDVTSIAIYGRRYFEYSEQDTRVDPVKLGDAILSDLSTPTVDHQVTSLDVWAVELGDIVSFPANSVHYNSTQIFAVVGIHREWADGEARMTLQTRGKPSGAYFDWLRRGSGRPSDDGLPRPTFGLPIGEGSEGGGVSGDGMVWMDYTFDANTEEIRVHVEETEADDPPVPDVSAITLAWTLTRQEGEDEQARDFAGALGMGTRPDWWKRIRAFGVNKNGALGPETVFDPVQAVDTVEVLDGVVSDVRLTADPDGSNVIDVDIGAIDPVVPSYVYVMRNGIIIFKRFLGITGGNTTEPFTDRGINLSTPHTYVAFIWTQGVTGKWHSNIDQAQLQPVPLPFPNTIAITSIGVVNVAGTNRLRITYAMNVLYFARAVLMESATIGGTYIDTGTYQLDPSFGQFYYYPVPGPLYFKVRGESADGSLSLISPAAYWDGVTPVVDPSPADLPPRFINNTPKILYVAGVPNVVIEYDQALSWFATMYLEVGVDGVNFSDMASSPYASGIFSDTNVGAKYYRLRAEGSGGTPVLRSQPAFFWGLPQVPGGGLNTNVPVFTFTVRSRKVGVINYPVLDIEWTCDNPDAAEVSIEESTDDGVSDAWSEIYRSGFVAFGLYVGDAFTRTYYRMKCYTAFGAPLSTSASQFYNSLLF